MGPSMSQHHVPTELSPATRRITITVTLKLLVAEREWPGSCTWHWVLGPEPGGAGGLTSPGQLAQQHTGSEANLCGANERQHQVLPAHGSPQMRPILGETCNSTCRKPPLQRTAE